MKYLLAGDIGGTNTRLRLVRADTLELVKCIEYSSPAHSDLAQIVGKFLDEVQTELGEKPSVSVACFGIAGPIVDRTCTTSNLAHWALIDADELQRTLNIPHVELINDFVAIGYGISQLPPSDLYTLQTGKIQPQAPKATIGAGTGLGEGILVHDGTEYLVLATEGGHSDYAARSIQEFEFVQYMCQTYHLDRLSYDRVVSGPGIVAFYQFLRDTTNLAENPDVASVVKLWEAQTEKSANPAQLISAMAIAKTDQLCENTMRMFISAYGAEAGNVALNLLAFGGLYLAGGIAAKNIPLLTDGTFLTAFSQKGRMKELMAQIPIYVILNPQVGLIGAVARSASLNLKM